MKNSENIFLKYFEWFHPVEAIKIVHCTNARYALVVFASVFISGHVFGADVEPKLLHLDCKRIHSGFKQSLEINSGYIFINASGGEIWCKGGAEIGSSKAERFAVGQLSGMDSLSGCNINTETISRPSTDERAKDSGNSLYWYIREHLFMFMFVPLYLGFLEMFFWLDRRGVIGSTSTSRKKTPNV